MNVRSLENFSGGIADYTSAGEPNSYAYGRSIDVRSDPKQVTILPKTIKESGSVVTDLLKWADTYPSTLDTYLYGDTGKIYKRTSAGSTTLLRTVANSSGNGLVYSPDDDHIYYTSDKLIGRYGPLGGTPSFVDDYFGSQGGVPLNTNSLDLEASSSQYASVADTASLSITSDIAIDMQIKPESLPSVGAYQTLLSKWDESGTLRSYRFDIAGVSGYFGDGTDGTLTISSNTTEAPIDSSCSGTSGTQSLSATNASFATDQVIFIHQTRGTGAGTWQRNKIQSYSAGTITTVDALNATYTDSGSSQAQVRVLKQYTNVTINSGITYTAKAWDGDVGGILAFLASGTVTVTGTITATGKGFRGGSAGNNSINVDPRGQAGEGTAGVGGTTQPTNSFANGNGGGGGTSGSSPQNAGAGGGGGNGTAGTSGTVISGSTAGTGGSAVGTADLTTMLFGGGGGGGQGNNNDGGAGGNGGGIVFISGATITIAGSITSNGSNGGGVEGGGGGGAGGSILLKAQTATLGSSLVTATGGAGGATRGGSGGTGRIHLDYYTSYTGTTSPTLDAAQDNSLVTNTTYQLRLSVSSNGTNTETLAQEFTPSTSSFQQVGVSWDASDAQAVFYFNGASIGTRTGSLTAIHNNASDFHLGAMENSGGSKANFFDGLIDEVRLFNTTRTAAQMYAGISNQIATNTTGLVGYWKLNNDYADSTANANNLTASGSPVFSSSVPFPAPTTRLDIDQSLDTSGNTYTTPTSINEGATHRQTFTPAKDPQKSIQFNVAAVGTGDWTVTIHDAQNNTVATSTVTNANMRTGDYEFTYSSVWRPLTNFTNNYHAHITSTVNDGTVTTTTASDLETADFVTYYQFLVEDTDWHPMARFLNFWVVGNERHVGKYEVTYNPHVLTFPAGYRVRCFGYFREYLAIGVMRGSNIQDFDTGRVYFWDGYSTTFTHFIDVPEGGVNALLGSKGKLYIVAGYQGDILEYTGGDTAQKIKSLPKMEVDKRVEIYPQAITMWKTLLRFAPTVSNSSTLERLVYTYGSKNLRYPEILTADHPISTGNYNSNVSISLLHPVGEKLLIGWKDNISYGLDYVDLANDPYSSARIELLIDDLDASYKEKESYEVVATFDALASGETMKTSYLLDDDTSYTQNPDSTSTGDEVLRQMITNSRFREIQAAVDLETTGTTSPTLKAVSLVGDTLPEEERYG